MTSNRATRWMMGAIVGALSTLPGPLPGAIAAAGAAESDVRGVTRSTVSVAGIVSGDAANSPDAAIGAQARLRRENSRGGVAGRTVNYIGTEVDHGSPTEHAAAVTKLAASAFAVVPMSSSAIDAELLERQRIPFFGSAVTTAWERSAVGFGFAGAQAVVRPRTASPAWGQLLRELLGGSRGRTVTMAIDSSALGTSRGDQARASVRAAGFSVLDPVVVPAPATQSAPPPDLMTYAAALVASKADIVLLLTSPEYTAFLASAVGGLGFTGTVGADNLYDPGSPAIANGVTVLTPFAPLQEDTRANRQMVADVQLIKPDQALNASVVAGYWAADLFLATLKQVGPRLSVDRFLEAANRGGFTHSVPRTVGPTRWPAMHREPVPCGALTQSDGTEFLLAAPYRCGKPIRLPAK